MANVDLVLKPACENCASSSDLYGTGCRHTTLCSKCAREMYRNKQRCNYCSALVTKLVREYPVRATPTSDKSYSIGRFVTGLPPFSKKKNAENKWSLQKEGLQGRQVTDAVREKFKNKPWLLEDETGQHQYQGQVEGAQAATYHLLALQGKEFYTNPAGSWYNFNKIAQYKQLTLEEAEEKMNKRKNNATGYERWMMKAATNGPAVFGSQAVFGDVKKEGGDGVDADGNRPRKGKNNTVGEPSDKGEGEEEEKTRKRSRHGLDKKGVDDDDDDGHAEDFDRDDDGEKGEHWDDEENFTDDDETNDNGDGFEKEDFAAAEIPIPPEIKQDDDDEDDDNEEEGGLSKSGKELKKLLGKAAGLIDEEDGQTGDDDDDDDDENNESSVLAPKKKDTVKDEHADNTPAKAASSGSVRGTPPTSKSSKAKRKAGSEDVKTTNGVPAKKELNLASVKEEQPTSSKATVAPKVSISPKVEQSTSTGPVTEDEIRTALLQVAPMTTQDLVAIFKSRLKTPKDKAAFAEILRKISKIQKSNGQNYVVLREKREKQ